MLPPRRAPYRFVLGTLAALCCSLLTSASHAREAAADTEARFAPLLEAHYETLLQHLRPLLSDEEADAFLRLQGHRRRMAFIEAFWQHLDPTPGDSRNPLRERWQAQVRDAQRKYQELRDLEEVRAQVRRPCAGCTVAAS